MFDKYYISYTRRFIPPVDLIYFFRIIRILITSVLYVNELFTVLSTVRRSRRKSIGYYMKWEREQTLG